MSWLTIFAIAGFVLAVVWPGPRIELPTPHIYK